MLRAVTVLDPREIERQVRLALAEDVGSGDATTLATVPVTARARAVMRTRQPLVLAGLALAQAAFRAADASLQIDLLGADGRKVPAGFDLLRVSGPARGILSAERVALNFVQRLSGIATLTEQYVTAVADTNAKILDTRKTTPGLRLLEKYAVRCGGGNNHRLGLFDMILIKDNHLVALHGAQPNPIAAAVHRARQQFPDLKVEVEADTLEQVEHAIDAGADFVLLDNMTLDQLRQAVERVARRLKTEASGGVNLTTIRSIAATGVDFISVGALTHSAPAVDIGLDFESPA